MKRSLHFFLLIAALASICVAQTPTPPVLKRKFLSERNWSSKLEPGDIVFIRSRTANAALIAALSNVEEKDDADDVFTHCGIIFKDGAELKVYEGEGRGAGNHLTLSAWQEDESKGEVNGVKKNDLHHIYAMRWNGQPELATGLDKLLKKAKELHDTRYDHGFFWTDKRAYCSELVWRAFEVAGFRLGKLPTMGEYVALARPDVAQKVKDKLEAAKNEYREGRGYLPNESAISPEDIYKSSVLTPITD